MAVVAKLEALHKPQAPAHHAAMGKKPQDIASPKSGPLAFDRYYGSQIGERWNGLRESCRLPSRHFRLQAGLLKPYFLDPASVFAAIQLDVRPGQAVLDLCAAPGGKSLVLSQTLFGLAPPGTAMAGLGELVAEAAGQNPPEGESENPAEDQLPAGGPAVFPDPPAGRNSDAAPGISRLVANERSATRRGRLRAVLSEHLPQTCLAAIATPGHDASGWGQYQQDAYDRILLDAPCSSERHLIQSPSYLREWSEGRTRQLAQQAYAMGLSAGRALKAGGLLLYCTCALSSLENDETIARIIDRSLAQSKRFGFHLELAPPATDGQNVPDYLEIETTGLGSQIWPDRTGAFGPLYFCRLQKIID